MEAMAQVSVRSGDVKALLLGYITVFVVRRRARSSGGVEGSHKALFHSAYAKLLSSNRPVPPHMTACSYARMHADSYSYFSCL